MATDIQEELQDYSIFAWIDHNDIKTETGERLDFKKYSFLKALYADHSRLICCMKAAQIGFSTYEILKTAFECRNEGIDIIYVLPSDDDVNRFSGGKTNKIINQNSVMQSWTKDKDSTYQKQFGNNTIYYEGAWTERAALSTTAKKLVVDEFDRCKQEVIEQYDSRLQSTAEPRKAFFSNPSLPNTGVHSYYLLSDQKKWHINHSCGKQVLLDESTIDYKAEIFKCPHCIQEITDDERRDGEWIATAQGEWSGYWIPLWLATWMSAKDIAKTKREKTAEYFANFVAGMPHILGNDIIAPEVVLKNCTDEAYSKGERVIIGVDTGLPIYYTLMNQYGAFAYGSCRDTSEGNPYDDLRALLDKYKDSILISDQGGDLIGIRLLREEYPGRVFLCYYEPPKKEIELIEWGKDEEFGKVKVDRNRYMQLIIEQLREENRIPIYGSKDYWKEWAAHFGHIYREKVVVREAIGKDDKTLYGTSYVWKRRGADHYVHSFVYAMVGIDKYGQQDSYFAGKEEPKYKPRIPVSSYREADGTMANTIEVIYPEIPSKIDDWRRNV